MRTISKLALLLSLFLLASFSFAQESTESQELLDVLTPIHSLQANFVQTIVDGKGKLVQKSEGKLSLERPGKFRWEVAQPIKQVIVANSTRLWIYDPDLEQVVVRPVAKEIGRTPAFLLTNVNSAINNDFKVSRMSAPQNWQWFSLTPKGKDNIFNGIQLGFLNRQIKEIRMQDNIGHHTVIQLQQVKENLTLSSALFVFHAPAKVDVIDETR